MGGSSSGFSALIQIMRQSLYEHVILSLRINMWLGQQLIMEIFECRTQPDVPAVLAMLRELPPRLGLTIVSGPTVTAAGAADETVFTGLVILAESHLALHAFPLERALHLDLFSCKRFDAELVEAVVRASFVPARMERRLFERET
jgi:S-adenosylmethionine/arginine decarboxylase-like enzyme